MEIKLVGRETAEQITISWIQMLKIELIGMAGNHLLL